MKELRVLLVSDDPLARAGLATLLAEQPGVSVVAQVSGGADVRGVVAGHEPDAVLWDLGWEPGAAVEYLGALGDDGPPVLALLSSEAIALDAWNAGARGLLLRSVNGESLAASLRAVKQGAVVLAPEVAASLVRARERPPQPQAEELTAREQEVLRLMAEGLANKAIGLRLGITEHTVKFHVNAILGKLGAQGRTDAVMRATRLGLNPV